VKADIAGFNGAREGGGHLDVVSKKFGQGRAHCKERAAAKKGRSHQLERLEEEQGADFRVSEHHHEAVHAIWGELWAGLGGGVSAPLCLTHSAGGSAAAAAFLPSNSEGGGGKPPPQGKQVQTSSCKWGRR
jgi:hypothetical protein